MIDALLASGREAIASGQVRHWGGFLLAGLSALATDTAILSLLTRLFGLSPFVARPFGIAVAMIVSWSINRTITFKVAERASLFEFLRFAGVSITSQIVNYLVFAAILLGWPMLPPEAALVAACFVSMIVSYTGFRFGVFGSHSVPTNRPPTNRSQE